MRNARSSLTILALAAAVVAAPIAALAQSNDPSPRPLESTLSVTGEATIERAPDQVKVALDIVTDDPAATASTSKNNDLYNAIRAKLLALGLRQDAIATNAFGVAYLPFPPKDLPADQRRPRYGYITTRSLVVTSATLDDAGKIIDAANAGGATSIGGVSFGLKDQTAAQDAASAAALVAARRSADALAATGAFTILKIRSVSSNDVPYEPQAAPLMFAKAAAPTPTEIAPPGPIQLRASVSVVYVIR